MVTPEYVAVPVGMSRSRDHRGSWILGPSERTIGAHSDVTSPESYSWAWRFEPRIPDEGDDYERVGTRIRAREQVRRWQVDWCPPQKRAAAEFYLFGSVEGEDATASDAVAAGIELPSAQYLAERPLKFHATWLAGWVGEQLVRERKKGTDSYSECDVLTAWGLSIAVVPRRGILTPTEPSDSSPISFLDAAGLIGPARSGWLGRGRRSTLADILVSTASKYEDGERCLALLPGDRAWGNDVDPVDPWAEVSW